jgi:hypothetical protein
MDITLELVVKGIIGMAAFFVGIYLLGLFGALGGLGHAYLFNNKSTERECMYALRTPSATFGLGTIVLCILLVLLALVLVFGNAATGLGF